MTFTLKKRKARGTDFSFHKSHFLGSIPLPSDFDIPTVQLDQDQEDCTAYQACMVRDAEIPGAAFDPSAFWQDELAFADVPSSQGFDLGVPAAVGVKSGFCKVGGSVRGNCASAYFWITPNGGMDLFDSVRSAIYGQKRPVSGGLTWMDEWTAAPGGVIDFPGKNEMGGHCMGISGWRTLDGVLQMRLPNTWGASYGDDGSYWMTREIFNQALSGYGIYQWSDTPNTTIKTLGLIEALYQNIMTLLGK